jgi:polyketide synthase PksL
LAKEYPHWSVRLFDLDASSGSLPLAELVRFDPQLQGQGYAWREGLWYAPRWLPIQLGPRQTERC